MTSSAFVHGVASGDPLPEAVVLWTRVTPSRDAVPGSSVGPDAAVQWEVATNTTFATIVARGTVVATAAHDHTVKVDATGLRPATSYVFRFRWQGQLSDIGTTRTAPAAGAELARLRLGVVSCSNYQAGYFSAYRHLRNQSVDVVLHLGDYIYEYGDGGYGKGSKDEIVRRLDPPHEILTLADYRRRYAHYRGDPDLRALHASVPFICTWDDHETANDSWAGGAENHDPATEGSWADRVAAAHRAYDEWMPIRLSGTAVLGDGDRIYRRFGFGQLAQLDMLDLRSYRNTPGTTGTVTDPNRTTTGEDQFRWLTEGLAATTRQWKLIGNSFMIAPLALGELSTSQREAISQLTGDDPAPIVINKDQWDGFQVNRRRLLEFLDDHGIVDTIFLTGDIHSAWANDVTSDPGAYPFAPRTATEFVCTSVTSNNIKDITNTPAHTTSEVIGALIHASNPHVQYVNLDDHGFSVLDVRPEATRMDYYVIGDRSDPRAGAKWSVSFEVEATSQRLRRVWTAPTTGGAA